MITIDSPAAMQRWARQQRAAGRTIGFVPTMGFLHEGHRSLMRIARREADVLVVSIFVNPLQFGPNEDLDRYPRDLEGDLGKCRAEGAEIVFLPTSATMYPAAFETTLKVGSLAAGLCGASRPGHFDGVATVVLKLFQLVQPHAAVFGEKDYQQLAIIRRMVADLDVDVRIVPGPIVREADGLAMSSRNVYLSADERRQALALSRSLGLAEEWARQDHDAASLRARIRAEIERSPLADIDYVEVVGADDLAPFHAAIDRSALVALAVRFGRTRLIDNRVLPR